MYIGCDGAGSSVEPLVLISGGGKEWVVMGPDGLVSGVEKREKPSSWLCRDR